MQGRTGFSMNIPQQRDVHPVSTAATQMYISVGHRRISAKHNIRNRSVVSSSGAEERAAAGLARTLHTRRNDPFKTPLTSTGQKAGLKHVETEIQGLNGRMERFLSEGLERLPDSWDVTRVARGSGDARPYINISPTPPVRLRKRQIERDAVPGAVAMGTV
ncbi:hypothetical protein D4764_16G0003750 [Takifugu flavidus]|uniref:Uncharacterized protein n=1 Tax=Takifugu flavidus TaxID=433684 RepID=A0A5C6NYJ4_9TELE|nr:hypothetical protein D4764_16G0003750 [Takifugu flavidus]